METQHTYTIKNPATGEEAGRYDIMDRETVNEAVKKAKAVFKDWSKTDFRLRKRILKKAISVIANDPEKYAEVIS